MNKKIEVGQTILRFEQRGEPKEVTVTRVGPKWLYIEMYGREEKYSVEFGSTPDGYSFRWVRTVEEHAETTRRVELEGILYKHGFKLDHSASVSTEALEQVVAVLGGDA